MDTILNRIEQIANNEDIKITSLERAIGASKGVLSRAIHYNTDIQAKWLQLIVEKYPLYSGDWLLTGRGGMLRASAPGVHPTPQPQSFPVVQNFFGATSAVEQQIPVYDVQNLRRQSTLLGQQLTPKNFLYLPDLPPCDGAVMMQGNMMDPELKGGDLIVYKKVKDLKTGLYLGHIYLLLVELEGEEHIMINYVKRSQEQDCVKLEYKNDFYPSKDVPREAIREAAMVKASVRYYTML